MGARSDRGTLQSFTERTAQWAFRGLTTFVCLCVALQPLVVSLHLVLEEHTYPHVHAVTSFSGTPGHGHRLAHGHRPGHGHEHGHGHGRHAGGGHEHRYASGEHETTSTESIVAPGGHPDGHLPHPARDHAADLPDPVKPQAPHSVDAPLAVPAVLVLPESSGPVRPLEELQTTRPSRPPRRAASSPRGPPA